MATRIQRRRKPQLSDVPDQKQKGIARLNELAEQIRDRCAEIDRANADLAMLRAESELVMKTLQIEELEAPGYGTHEYKPTKSNRKNIVDPKGFKKLVSDNEFWAAVEVPIMRARELLGAKELESITTTIPGEVGPPKYVFKLPKMPKK